MPRFFMEVSYKGDRYSGFQVQKNANTIQAEVERALQVFLKTPIELTGSSRTDAGVHALQNFFHFDLASGDHIDWQREVYRINAILPPDIVVKRVFAVAAEAHCRFDADYRRYEYAIYSVKDPFIADYAYYYPYKLDIQRLHDAADLLLQYKDFSSFSKRNSQVKSKECKLLQSKWEEKSGKLVYSVKGNRFLRGMVKGLVGTMLRVGRGKISLEEFKSIIESGDPAQVDFSVPGQGLMLKEVHYGY